MPTEVLPLSGAIWVPCLTPASKVLTSASKMGSTHTYLASIAPSHTKHCVMVAQKPCCRWRFLEDHGTRRPRVHLLVSLCQTTSELGCGNKCSSNPHLCGMRTATNLSSVMATMHQQLTLGPQYTRNSRVTQSAMCSLLRCRSNH